MFIYVVCKWWAILFLNDLSSYWILLLDFHFFLLLFFEFIIESRSPYLFRNLIAKKFHLTKKKFQSFNLVKDIKYNFNITFSNENWKQNKKNLVPNIPPNPKQKKNLMNLLLSKSGISIFTLGFFGCSNGFFYFAFL